MERPVPKRKLFTERSVPKLSPVVAGMDARVRRTRAGLRQALLELLEIKALEHITIREIAEQAKVGYTTYYRHYSGKDELLDDVAAEETDQLLQLTIPVYATEDSYASLLALCRHVDTRRRVWSALLIGGAAGVIREHMLRLGREDASECLPAATGLPRELGFALVVAVTVEVLTWWLRQAEPFPVETIAYILNQAAIVPNTALAMGDLGLAKTAS